MREATTNVACSRISDTGTAQRKVSSSSYSRPFIRFFPSAVSSFLRHFPQRLDKVATNVGWDYCSFPPFFSGWSGFLLFIKKNIFKFQLDIERGTGSMLCWDAPWDCFGEANAFFIGFYGGRGRVAKGLSLSLAIFTLSYPLFNTPLKNPFFAPLYAYLRTSISTRDFHQIVSFSVEIFACQELFCVVTLPAELSATTMTTETRN